MFILISCVLFKIDSNEVKYGLTSTSRGFGTILELVAVGADTYFAMYRKYSKIFMVHRSWLKDRLLDFCARVVFFEKFPFLS